MSAQLDQFNLDVRVQDAAAGGTDPDSISVVTRLVCTRVTCRSCTCISCVTQCPLGCW